MKLPPYQSTSDGRQTAGRGYRHEDNLWAEGTSVEEDHPNHGWSGQSAQGRYHGPKEIEIAVGADWHDHIRQGGLAHSIARLWGHIFEEYLVVAVRLFRLCRVEPVSTDQIPLWTPEVRLGTQEEYQKDIGHR